MKISKIDIILPTYYEQGNIEKVVEDIEKYVKTPHVITAVIQDKKDPTIKELEKLKKRFKNLKVVFTKDGKGILKAFKEGFRSTKAPVIVTMMSDLSDNPKDIDKMIKKIDEGYDLVCASRYSNPGKRIGGPKIKGFLSWLACISLKSLTGINTSDSTNAFKTFRRSLLNEISIESNQGFEMPLELTVKAHEKGFKIGEVSTIWKDRKSGKSQFNLKKNIPYYLKWYIYGVRNNLFFSNYLKRIS